MSNVNFSFISALEGGPVLTGYVPDPEHSNSGVTIATGFDLGQRSREDLLKLLPANFALINKLSPYCGLRKYSAVNALNHWPLQITAQQAGQIDNSVKQQLIKQLKQRYNHVAVTSFDDLPEPMQTVIASVAFQYGNLSQRCPKFWQAAIACNSAAMVAELRNFGDRYQTRRHTEANYLIHQDIKETV